MTSACPLEQQLREQAAKRDQRIAELEQQLQEQTSKCDQRIVELEQQRSSCFENSKSGDEATGDIQDEISIEQGAKQCLARAPRFCRTMNEN
jgi:DNA-binding transcriptional MerR regulator